ncbi:MAG: flagellin lysine-N-methylase [Solibacillus sp.]
MKQEILIPTYYNEFKCIGSACEDTCCAGWKVTVDKESFNKYRKITSGPLAEDLKKNISRERKTPSDQAYGKIKMDNEGRCTLLADDGLCKIHAELGEEYLCHTCTTYPRYVHAVDERLEKSMTLSCPEAARLILLNPDGIDFVIDEEEVKKVTHNQTADHFWDIRMFTIELLQTRTATIEERLIVLGMFIEKLDSTKQSFWQQELPTLITRYRTLINDQEQLALLQSLPNNISFQMDLVRRLIQTRLVSGLKSQRYVDCLNDLIDGLQMIEGSTIEQSMNLYNQSYNNHYRPFMQDNAYILENYLVNFIFKNTFPNDSKNLFQQYTNLVIHFILIKLHIIGIASKQSGLTDDLLLKCIQSFSKTFEHNSQFFKDTLNELEKQNYITMAHMTILIKS